MTKDKMMNLIKFASYNGIKTFGELAEYKREKRIQSNGELYISLYHDALAQVRRNEARGAGMTA